MSRQRLIEEEYGVGSSSSALSSSHSMYRGCVESTTETIFEELPKATIVSVSRPDATDFSPLLLSYTIQLQYKQFKWQIEKKASQVIYLHFSLRKRALIEELHEKQEQVKEWLQNIGIGEQTSVVHDDDEPDDGALPVHNEDSVRSRYVPSRAAFSVIRPSLSRQQTVSERAKVAMQGYLNHFLGNLDIVNSKEVCMFLEVSKLSLVPEFGPKLKEGYVSVSHLTKMIKKDGGTSCCLGCWSFCCNSRWQKVWAVLKPGFLALLNDPFDAKLLDIIIFDVLPVPSEKGESGIYLVEEIKTRNPLLYAFKVSCGTQSMELRTTSNAKVKHWIRAINEVGVTSSEGWCRPHRFGSFAPQRSLADESSKAQWFVDGQVAFDAIATAIESAKSEIYMTGWWLCPELYLRRPYHNHRFSRLDALLEAKAKQGVQIYILLYKEVSIALKINSLYSKRKLLDIHENVKVLRHPNRFPTGVYLWSHHEKIVVVDHRVCFIGGLDLCFGRYDTTEHKIGDHPPFLWPGKDYYNPRESEPNSWEDVMKEELERGKCPRMPWHDVHCALWGPSCQDIARHFVQRWNHAKKNKAPNEQAIPLLMPQHHMVLPHYMGRSTGTDIQNINYHLEGRGISREDSFSSLSPPDDVPLLMPPEANGIHYSDTDCHLRGVIPDRKVKNASEAVTSSIQKSEKQNPKLGFTPTEYLGGLHNENILQNEKQENQPDLEVLVNWWETQERGYQVPSDEVAEVGPLTSCSCQVIRSVSQWSAGTSQTEDSIHRAYCSLIEKAEHFIYIENQFFISGTAGDEIIQNRVAEALYNRILLAHKEHKCFRAIIVIPLLAGFQGGLDDNGAATVRALTHWQYRSISREGDSLLHKLNAFLGPKASDYISFYGLRTHGLLCDGGPLVTNQVYVHSKVMIVDDRVTLVGSSNINDRSLLGSRDSEIGIVIEDKELLDSSMNGEPWKAGKFSFSLRISLWAEHLGLKTREVNQITDPIAEKTYKELWMETARSNAKIYQDVFSCIPNDNIHSRSDLRQSMNYWKEKLGHTTIDLGVAPETVERSGEEEVEKINPKEMLKMVRGFLVSFPLEFMRDEDLRPAFLEGEFYTSSQVFH